MKIFRIHSDNEYWALMPTKREPYLKQKLFQLERMSDGWRDFSFYVKDPVRSKRGNFFNLSLGCLAYDKDVFLSDLEANLERAGEVLDATLDGIDERFYVFNPIACYNCLDRKNTQAEWTPDGTVAVQVQKFAFHVDRIGDCDVFKIPEMKRVGLFALVGRDEPEDEFYAQYQALGFTGLKFEEVWTDEVG